MENSTVKKKRGRPAKVKAVENVSVEGDDNKTLDDYALKSSDLVDVNQLMARMEALEKRALEAEEKLENLEDEEARIAAREKELDRKAKEMYERQQKNRADPTRVAKLLAPRDPNVIRKMKGGTVLVTCKVPVGLDDETTSEAGEKVKLTKDAAKKLQKAGKVLIEI